AAAGAAPGGGVHPRRPQGAVRRRDAQALPVLRGQARPGLRGRPGAQERRPVSPRGRLVVWFLGEEGRKIIVASLEGEGAGKLKEVTVHGPRVPAVQTGIGPARTRGLARPSPRRGRRLSGGGIGRGPSRRPGRAGEAFSSSYFRLSSDMNYRQ